MGSFFSSLKKEKIRRHIFKTGEDASVGIFDYIEVFYNRARRHQHLGIISPEAYEEQMARPDWVSNKSSQVQNDSTTYKLKGLEKMKILSVVPARGGSKGLPGKNIRELCGKPLIAYAIEASIASDLVTDTVVSTDDPEIAKVGEAFGAQAIMRPPELAQDTSLVIDAMKHAVREQEKKGLVYNYIVLLEPTSPLRTVADIDDTIKMVVDAGADSGATFSETSTPPARVWRIANNVPATLIEGAEPFLPRQAHESGYYINGMVYVVKVPELMKTEKISFLLGKQVANVIPTDRVVDIDSLRDFEMAEFILSNKLKKQ